ncbi:MULTISPECIES: alpha/beta hydrolase [Streptomyces]|uniref:alpha/beta fold hydrolase n=1 Tax=Streptomyces TaxID=1883 RepID=UPI0014081D2E|nr:MULTISPECIES: alpha/beta hydrolase [Streptomyces]MDH6226513.1 pimeloyl-ACP methyl ester carboxylesterase [Streptomyces sp. MJP52]
MSNPIDHLTTLGRYQPPAPARESTVLSADGARISVEVHGPEDAPAVVLAHGWTCSVAFWAAQIRDLAGRFRVIAYDQRGHGGSPLHAPVGTEQLADDLEAVLAATLAPGEKAVIAGHSMGGMTVMAAAGRPVFREHAAAVLLCSTGASALVPESTVLPLRKGGVRTWLTGQILGSPLPIGGRPTAVSRRILKYGTMGAGSTPQMVEACARVVHACPTRARRAWSRVLASLELAEGVRRLDVPTEVIVGAVDRLTPPVHARSLAGELPDCLGLTELPGIGHMTPVEAPDVVTDRIASLAAAHLPPGTTAGGKTEKPGTTKESAA